MHAHTRHKLLSKQIGQPLIIHTNKRSSEELPQDLHEKLEAFGVATLKGLGLCCFRLQLRCVVSGCSWAVVIQVAVLLGFQAFRVVLFPAGAATLSAGIKDEKFQLQVFGKSAAACIKSDWQHFQ